MTIKELLQSLKRGEQVTFYGADDSNLLMIEVVNTSSVKLVAKNYTISNMLLKQHEDVEKVLDKILDELMEETQYVAEQLNKQ